MDGLLVVDKPSGPTSHDVVARMRRALNETRIGHTGTLDPMATGVLLLVVGKATRLAKFLSGSDKSYDAVVRFGFATDTADAQGRPLAPASDGAVPSREAIEAALDAFRGTFLQQPPAFSAKKIGGQRSYKLARRGREAIAGSAYAAPVDSVDPGSQEMKSTPDPCSVTAHAIRIISIADDCVTLSLDCSAGFYVRSLAHDLGERLGIGAHLAALRRTRVGDFGLDRAMALDAAQADPRRAANVMVPLAGMLTALPSVILTAEGVARVTHGQDIRLGDQVSSLNARPRAISPEPFSPQPFSPEPSSPEPFSPEPSSSEPFSPEPSSPEPFSPEPSSSEPFSPQPSSPEPFVRLLGSRGELLAIAEATDAGLLHPSVVLV